MQRVIAVSLLCHHPLHEPFIFYFLSLWVGGIIYLLLILYLCILIFFFSYLAV